MLRCVCRDECMPPSHSSLYEEISAGTFTVNVLAEKGISHSFCLATERDVLTHQVHLVKF